MTVLLNRRQACALPLSNNCSRILSLSVPTLTADEVRR